MLNTYPHIHRNINEEEEKKQHINMKVDVWNVYLYDYTSNSLIPGIHYTSSMLYTPASARAECTRLDIPCRTSIM